MHKARSVSERSITLQRVRCRHAYPNVKTMHLFLDIEHVETRSSKQLEEHSKHQSQGSTIYSSNIICYNCNVYAQNYGSNSHPHPSLSLTNNTHLHTINSNSNGHVKASSNTEIVDILVKFLSYRCIAYCQSANWLQSIPLSENASTSLG